MKRFCYFFIIYVTFSWLFCTLFLEIDFSDGGYSRLLTEPFNYLKSLSDTAQDTHNFITSAIDWFKDLFTFEGISKYLESITGFFQSIIDLIK